MKPIIMIFTTMIAIFSWILSPILPDKLEYTNFMVDGKY